MPPTGFASISDCSSLQRRPKRGSMGPPRPAAKRIGRTARGASWHPAWAVWLFRQRHQPQTGLFILGVEVQAVRVLPLVDNDGRGGLEFLFGDGGGGNLVDRVCLDVFGPARVLLLDPRPRIGRPAQKADELVVVEIDNLGARHTGTLALRVRRNYLKVTESASNPAVNRGARRIPGRPLRSPSGMASTAGDCQP